MIYRPAPGADPARTYREPKSKIRLPCLSRRDMRARYPGGGFAVIGEIGSRAAGGAALDTLAVSGGRGLPILPRGSLLRPFEWVAGYVPVAENAYVAAVRGILPAFLCGRR